jgi:putative transposase
LQQLTKRLLESAPQGELSDHLGYDKHDPAGRDGANSRTGRRAKTVLTDVGPVEIEVPRERDGSFEPRIVAKRQRRLSGVDELVISLSAKGLTTGEVQAHPGEVDGARGVPADHFHDHRQGPRGHGRVAEPAATTRSAARTKKRSW